MNKPAATQHPRRHARDYAQAIVDAQGDVARQREIFQACPEHWRALARELAKSALELAAKRTELLLKHRRLVRGAAERDTAPLTPTRRISALKQSSPEVGRQRLAELRATLGQKEPA